MKKLTAGIFATILGLTAIDAYAAQVASTNYVQGAINSLATVAKTGAYGDLTGKPSIPSIEGLATEAYVDQAEADAISTAAADATSKANAAEAAAKAYADANDADTIYDDTALSGRVKTLEDAGYITNAALDTYATKTYAETEADAAEAAAIAAAAADATSKANAAEAAAKAYADANDADTIYDDTALSGRVKTLEDAGYITNAALDTYATKTYAETEADAAEAAAIAAAAADATSKANAAEAAAKAYADANDADTIYDDTALKGRVTTIEGQQTTQDTAIAAAQRDATQALADAAAENEVNAAQQQVIDNLGTTYVKVSDVVDTYVAN